MAEEKKTVLFEVKAQMTDALKQLGELELAIDGVKEKQQECRTAIKEIEEAEKAGAISHEEAARAIAAQRAQLTELNERQKAYKKEMGEQSRVVQNSIIAEEKYKGTLKGLCAELSVAKDRLRAMKLEDPGYKEQAKYVDELNTKVKELEAEYGVHTRNVGNYEGAVRTLRDEMKNLMDQIVGLRMEGKENTEEYKEASEKLAEYRDIMNDTQQQTNALASDTKGLDAAMSGVAMSVGGLTIMIKIFDDGSESGKKIADILKKLQVITLALNAAQAISNKTQKQGILYQTALKVQTLATAAAKKLEAKVTAQATGATLAQIVAQKILNAVMAANPVLLIVSGVAALTVAFIALTEAISANKEEHEKQKKAINDMAFEYEFAKKKFESYMESVQSLSQTVAGVHTARVEGLLELYKQGLDDVIKAYEITDGKVTDETEALEDALKGTKDDLVSASKEAAAYIRSIMKEANAARAKKEIGELAYEIQLAGEEAAKAKRLIYDLMEAGVAFTGSDERLAALRAIEDKYQADTEAARQRARQRAQQASDRAYDLRQKELELDFQLTKAWRKKKEQYIYDEDLTARQNAEARIALEKNNALNAFEEQQQYEKDKLDLQLQYGKITEAQYRQHLQVMEQEREAYMEELAEFYADWERQLLEEAIDKAGGLSVEKQIEQIKADYQDAIDEIRDSDKLSAEEKDFYIRRLERNRAADIKEVRKKAEEETSREILAALADQYSEDLRQFSNNEAEKLAYEVDYQKSLIAAKKAAGLQTYADEAKLAQLEAKQKKQIIDAELQMTWNNAREQYRIRKEFIEKELELEGLAAEQRAALEEELAELIAEKRQQQIEGLQEYSNAAQEIASSLNSLLAGLEDAKVSKAEDDNEKQKKALDKRLKAGLISQRQYDVQVAAMDEDLDKKKRKIARDQAIREKAMSAMQIGINTAAAIMKIWAEVPKADFGVSTGILTALAAAVGAVQLAAVLSTPLPQARKGGRIEGPKHEQGGVLVNTEGEERIISSAPARAFPELLNLISYIGKHSGVPDTGYAARAWAAENGTGGRAQAPATTEGIDIDLLARKIGENVVEGVKGLQIFTSLQELRDANDEQSRIENAAKM